MPDNYNLIKNRKTGRMIKNQFSEFKIAQELIESLNVLGYLEPTDIQKEVIPEALKHCDIVAKSQTGSGKTAAFGIPLCEMAIWEENLPGALVLEPTRELTVQVKQELFRIGRYKRLKVSDLFGGFPIDKQTQTLKQKNHIAVGTPGRVMDHIRRESLITDNIKYLIIDEADLMLDMGFIDEVEAIIKTLPKDISIMMFSATLGDGLERLIRKYMKDPVTIFIEAATETVSEVEQVIYEVDAEGKYVAFLSLLIQENPDSAMIFCGTREMVNVLCRRLGKDNVRCGMIHGEIDQQDRLRTIEGFRQGRFHFLIATDVAARGIDFDNLTHVFNYDFPTGRESYVHRIGRTARNGKTGKAVSIVCDMDKKMLGMVEDYIHFTIKKEAVPKLTSEQEDAFFMKQKEKVVLREKKGAGFSKTITKLSIGGGKKSKMRTLDIVGTICSIEDMGPEDIGVIDIRESLVYVEILNNKGKMVLEALQDKTIKGKVRKVRITKSEA